MCHSQKKINKIGAGHRKLNLRQTVERYWSEEKGSKVGNAGE